MTNPILEKHSLPLFSKIQAEHVVPAIQAILAENREQLNQILAQSKPHSWQSLVSPLEIMEDKLRSAWSPVSHLNAVMNNPPLRDAYNTCLPLLSEYSTEIGQNKKLYAALESLANNDDFLSLSGAQQKVITNALRDFKLSGVNLIDSKQKQFKKNMQKLAELQSKFQDNILDATNAWTKKIDDIKLLSGLPDTEIALAKQTAEQRNDNTGWLLTLEFPSYFGVMTYADNRSLRQEVYTAFVTRASDQGPDAGRWDNSKIIEEILQRRYECAKLLGFDNYAEYSLATKMAQSSEQVLNFLNDLADKSYTVAKAELAELSAFAIEQDNLDRFEAWDVLYYSEKLRQQKYNITQEELKPFFPDSQVLSGLFAIVEKLYGLHIKEKSSIDSWHDSVRFFEIYDQDERLRGQFYLDLFARQNKRGGAWMDTCRSRMSINGITQHPVAYLNCNFSPGVGNDPALLTHSEVITLFHEFGHGLHHMLTQIDYPSISGINGVSWDAVELPSQFMENWCWERQALDLISAHYQSNKPIPDEMLSRLRAAKNFESAMMMVRQLEFGLFDFRLHREYQPESGLQFMTILEEVRNQVAVINTPEYNRFTHSFAHIFAGGYAAGYYSYKWAEVLSADAYSLFEENGIFDASTGQKFLKSILEQGGSKEAMDLFVEFRGRKPTVDALLKQCGLCL